MNSKRIVFLLLAVIVAGATAFLARAWLQYERAAIAAQMGGPRPVAKPAVQVLVARNAIHTGQIVKPDDLRWQSWPQGNLRADLHRRGQAADRRDFVGAVARGPFHVGEPIVEASIVHGRARAASWPPCCSPAARRQRADHGDLDGVGLHLCRRSRRCPADPRADRHERPGPAQRDRDHPAQRARDRDGPEARLLAGRQARRRQDRDPRAHRQADRDRHPCRQDGRPVAGAAQPAGSAGRRARLGKRRECDRPSPATASPTTAR